MNNNLAQALQYAIDVLDSYALDIRNGEWTGVDLVAKGFCQGRVYLEAKDTIARIVSGKCRPYAKTDYDHDHPPAR